MDIIYRRGEFVKYNKPGANFSPLCFVADSVISRSLFPAMTSLFVSSWAGLRSLPPAPDVGFCHITVSSSHGEVCCPASCVQGVRSWKGTDPKALRRCVSAQKGFLLLCSKLGLHPSPLPPQGLERLYPKVRILQQRLRGWAVKSITKTMLSSYAELYIFKALYWHKLINGEESNS